MSLVNTHTAPPMLPDTRPNTPEKARLWAVLARFWLLLRLVRREIPVSLRRFWVLIACLALGVAMLTAVETLSAALQNGLQREGRTLLGADASFTLAQREASAEEQALLARYGAVSNLVLARAMARNAANDSALVEIKGVDTHYPVLGALLLTDQRVLDPAALGKVLAPDAQGRPGLLAPPALVARLALKVGDAITIADAPFYLAGIIREEPDRLTGGVGFGSRVIVAAKALRQTPLLREGSLARYAYRLHLADTTSNAALEQILAQIARQSPDSGWQVASRTKASPQLDQQIQRFAQFLALVGLTALLIGGVGVANAVRAFVDHQMLRLATLKSLGASRNFVFASALAQVCAFGMVGIAIGLVLGTLLPMAGAAFAGELLPFTLAIRPDPRALGLGAAYGAATLLLFAMLPLLRAKQTPVAALLRDLRAETTGVLGAVDLVILALAATLFIALVIGFAPDKRIALAYLSAAGLIVVVLHLAARGVMRLARVLPHPENLILRLALGNLHRPGSLVPAMTISLGLGLTLLVMLSLIDLNLTRQFRASLPGVAPSFFFIDVPVRDMARFRTLITEQAREGRLEEVPQLRGRIVALNGVPVSEIKPDPRIAWVLEGDRGITYAPALPASSTLAAGEWWPADYKGPPLVSLAQDVAQGLGLKLHDSVRVNVLGRPIEAKIANFRNVRWQGLGINFAMVFSPNTFAGAPHGVLATLTFPAPISPEQESTITRQVALQFPAVSAIAVREALESIQTLVSQLGTAIRATSVLALASAVLVLAGAVSASARRRQREGVILKTLGATRRTLTLAMLAELALLGGITIVFALVCGSFAAQYVVTGLLNLEFSLPILPAALMALSALILTLILGIGGTWHLLGKKSYEYLRID